MPLAFRCNLKFGGGRFGLKLMRPVIFVIHGAPLKGRKNLPNIMLWVVLNMLILIKTGSEVRYD